MRTSRRKTTRRPYRHTTRMLNGARRPPPTNWLGLACEALEEVLRIDNLLRPFMAAEARLLEEQKKMKSVDTVLDKIYGPRTGEDPTPRTFVPASADRAQLKKAELALKKTKIRVAKLRSKLARRR